MIGLQRMRQRESRGARDLFVEPRVVLHRARAERVETRVDRDVELRQPREMPDDVDLGDLDLVRYLTPHQPGRKRIARLRDVERRKTVALPAALRVLEDQESFRRSGYRRHRRSLAIAAVSTATK